MHSALRRKARLLKWPTTLVSLAHGETNTRLNDANTTGRAAPRVYWETSAGMVYHSTFTIGCQALCSASS
eukprot:3522667-Alexandrium_andersonii.AAC.1